MASPTLCEQEQYDQNQEHRGRKSSTASLVVHHFSDLNITPPTTQACPTTTTAMASSSSTVYFPPSASALHQKRRKAKRHELRAPRPKNCFMLYRSKALPMIMVELGMINNKIISKIAAERWRAETEPVKAWYRLMAKQGKEEHARCHPGYKYAPHKKLMVTDTMAASDLDHADRSGHREAEDDFENIEQVESEQEADDIEVERSRLGMRGQDAYLSGTRRRSPRQRSAFGRPIVYGESRSIKKSKISTSVSNDFARSNKSREDRSVSECYDRDDTSPPTRRPKRTKGQCPYDSLFEFEPTVLQTNNNRFISPCSAFPVPTSGLIAPIPRVPLKDSSLIEQQLLLVMNAYENSQVHLQLYNREQRHMSIAQTSDASVQSIYELSADSNASSSTLVDPVNNWMAHRYQDPGSMLEHLDFSDVSKFGVNSNNMAAMQKMETVHSNSTMDVTKLVLDKDLPPLPFGSLVDTATFSDPNSIMSQLYAQYNPNCAQEFPSQSVAAKECEPFMFSMHDFEAAPAFKQDQFQQQEYLIKPASPSFLSFADVGEGAVSMMMDMFNWPSQGS
ncbi:hypothetical protein BGX28_002469 [Mortierella sp. GBA30]|nr:hypothetical protein BGX28_002469 [Mortierella sp. GBA30]